MKQQINSYEKDGEEFTIWVSDSIVNSPPYALVLECYLELVHNDMAIPTAPFYNHYSVLWVENSSKEIIGGIVYEYISSRFEGWIYLSFTAPLHRGHGVNKICHAEFEKIIISRGGKSIGSTVSVNNTARLNSAKKIGLEPKYFRMIKWL